MSWKFRIQSVFRLAMLELQWMELTTIINWCPVLILHHLGLTLRYLIGCNTIHLLMFGLHFLGSVAVVLPFCILYSTEVNLWWNDRNHKCGRSHVSSARNFEQLYLNNIALVLNCTKIWVILVKRMYQALIQEPIPHLCVTLAPIGKLITSCKLRCFALQHNFQGPVVLWVWICMCWCNQLYFHWWVW